MKLKLSAGQKADAIHSIRRYLSEEMEVEASKMQAGFLLDYFAKELAPIAYNQGVADSQEFMLAKAEDLPGTCFEEGLTYWSQINNSAKLVRRKPD